MNGSRRDLLRWAALAAVPVEAQNPVEAKRIVLRGLTWQHPRGYTPLVATAERYSQLHPSLDIRWQQLDWYAFEARVSDSLTHGTGEYDLVLLDHPWIGTFADTRMLLAFDEVLSAEERTRLKAAVVAPSLESYIYDGKLWALPIDAACHVFAYRKDLCDQAGAVPPGDWNAVLALARRLHDPPHRYALACAFGGVEGLMLFLTLAATFGFRPYANPREAVLPPRQAVQILELMNQLAQLCHPGSLDWTPRELLDHMSRADDVYMSPSVFGYVNFAETRDDRKALSFGTVPGASPGASGRAILGGMGLAIPAASRKKAEAIGYARFIASPEAQVRIFPANEGQPALRAAFEDDSVRARTGSFYPATLQCMATAYIRPRFPGWMEIELESGREITRGLKENVEPTQTLAGLERIRASHIGRARAG